MQTLKYRPSASPLTPTAYNTNPTNGHTHRRGDIPLDTHNTQHTTQTRRYTPQLPPPRHHHHTQPPHPHNHTHILQLRASSSIPEVYTQPSRTCKTLLATQPTPQIIALIPKQIIETSIPSGDTPSRTINLPTTPPHTIKKPNEYREEASSH